MSGYESRFTQPYQSGYTSSSASCSSTGNQNPMQGYPDLSGDYSYPRNMTQSSNSQFSSDMSLRASFEARTYGADSSSDSSVQLDNNRPKFGISVPKDPQELTCLYPGCRYTTARHFDLGRHMNKHFPPQGKLLDCPGKGCSRQDEYGFKRKDRLTEELRKVHTKDLPRPKKDSKSSRRERRVDT